jgi:hypothetical protein
MKESVLPPTRRLGRLSAGALLRCAQLSAREFRENGSLARETSILGRLSLQNDRLSEIPTGPSAAELNYRDSTAIQTPKFCELSNGDKRMNGESK